MEMESTRRAFDRSISKEPGLKKPRLIEDPSAQDRISNGRGGGLVQRSAVLNSGIGGGTRVQRQRDSESNDLVRGAYQPQPGPQLHQELVTQYKTALAELTFNSKPIITNLTIIAGESSHAAKAIAATICTNILEVPSEQKLPSLYLLDSIVKNIGKDYIRYFASKLPEVFCKAYRQVEPSMHQGMRHLFGTWKGVFPPQTLQMIERELGFTTAANGSPSRTTSRPDSQAQRPAHSIHVNPKYLEARQRMQTTRARESVSDTGGPQLTSHEDVEALERAASISSGRSWADPYAKPMQQHHRDQVNQPVRDKGSSVAYSDSEYGSSVLGRSGLGSGRVVENLKEPGYDRSWYESGSNVTGMSHQNGFGLKRGFESYAGPESANSDSDLQLKQKIVGMNTVDMSENWKNSEEEEYMWDEMNSRPTVRDAADASANDRWGPDSHVQLDFQSHIRRPQNVPGIGSRDDDEASADSISMDLGHAASGTQMLSWSRKLHPSEGLMLSEGGKSMSGYSEGYTTGLKNSRSAVGRTHSQSQLSPAHIGGSSLKFSTNPMTGNKASITQQGKIPVAAPSAKRSLIKQRSPSPSVSLHNPNQLVNNFAERNQTSIGPPTDPRRPPGHKNIGYRNQISEDSLPLPSRDVHQASGQKLQPQSFRSSSTLIASVQQRKNVPSAQRRNLEVSEFDMPSQVSGSESRSTLGNSSSDQSNHLTVDSPGKSITSISFDAVVKSGIPSISTLPGSVNKPSSQEVRHGSSLAGVQLPRKKVEQQSLSTGPPTSLAGIGSEKTPSAVSSSSNPFSSLLSSLVAKGLISSSKPDTLMPVSSIIPDQPLDRVPAIATTISSPVSSLPLTISKPLASITDVTSSLEPAVKASDGLPQPTAKIKQLIGFEFKPDVVRNSHPDVVSDLVSDLAHECSICGLRFKLQERLDRHMEWHASKCSEYNPTSNISRKWYVNVVDWVAGIGLMHHEDSLSDMLGNSIETLEACEQMVPADESQCACILCGELFEDFYSRERDEWMYKAAVYLTIPSSGSHESTATANDSAIIFPIVHASCVSEDSIRDLGLGCDVKVEDDV